MPEEDHKLQRAGFSTGIRTALCGMETFFRDTQTAAIFGCCSPLQCSAKAMLVLGEQMHLKSSQPWREARREELGFHPERNRWENLTPNSFAAWLPLAGQLLQLSYDL